MGKLSYELYKKYENKTIPTDFLNDADYIKVEKEIKKTETKISGNFNIVNEFKKRPNSNLSAYFAIGTIGLTYALFKQLAETIFSSSANTTLLGISGAALLGVGTGLIIDTIKNPKKVVHRAEAKISSLDQKLNNLKEQKIEIMQRYISKEEVDVFLCYKNMLRLDWEDLKQQDKLLNTTSKSSKKQEVKIQSQTVPENDFEQNL